MLGAFIFVGLSADETASMHEHMFMEETSADLGIRETLLGGDRAKDSFAWVLTTLLFVALATYGLRLKPKGHGGSGLRPVQAIEIILNS